MRETFTNQIYNNLASKILRVLTTQQQQQKAKKKTWQMNRHFSEDDI